MLPRIGLLALCASVLAITSAVAQQKPVGVRGTITQVDGPVLTVQSREGGTVKVKMSDDVKVFGVVKASLADVKPGTFVGSTAMPEPDGRWKAVEVHIFPESMRGTGEGDRAWDLKPKSTMTNGTVNNTGNTGVGSTVGGPVAKTEGTTLIIGYKNGEKKVDVAPDTAVVRYVPGSKDELKPGAKVFIGAATPQADKTLVTARVNVGRDIAPPM